MDDGRSQDEYIRRVLEPIAKRRVPRGLSAVRIEY